MAVHSTYSVPSTNVPTVNETEKSHALSWKDLFVIPCLFVKTLFDPIIDGVMSLGNKHVTHVKKEGLIKHSLEVCKMVGHHVKEHPYEVAKDTIVITLGNYPNLFGNGIFAKDVAFSIGVTKSALMLKHIIDTKDGKTFDKKWFKWLAVSGVALYALSLLPAAEAKSIREGIQNLRGDGKCPSDRLVELMDPVNNCIQEGGTLQSCKTLVTNQTISAFFK